MSAWTAADIPDQTGRVAVVTGANSGLGLQTATQLAAYGAHVVLACRDVAKGEAAAARIDAVMAEGIETGTGIGGSTEVRRLDLMDAESVRAFATDLGEGAIDVLVNNAGIMNTPLRRTAQGHESQFGVNVLGHFLLTTLLLPHLTDRVVWVSSLMHRMGRIDLADPGWQRRRYRAWSAYGQSKLAGLMLAYELQRRLAAEGSGVRSVAAHPGYARTNLQTRSESWQDLVLGLANTLPKVTQSAAEGALPILYAATVPDLPGGSYVGPGGLAQTRGAPRLVDSSAASRDTRVAADLWAECERLTREG